MNLTAGDVLLGKYRVDRVLGRGAMGLVVRAKHLALRQSVAIKVLLPSAAADPRFIARFRREAELMAKLRGEHSVRIHDVGVLDDGQPFIAMEYLEGRDLRAVVREDSPIAIDVAVGWVLQACEGVAEAHARGIVHRDLKPTNLFLTQRSDGSPLVKVLDFGVSKPPPDDEASQILTGTSAVLGSPRYMSPEQLRTPHEVDERTDVWALGAILQDILTGDPPFTGPTTAALCASIVGDDPTPLRKRRVDAPARLESALLHAFAKDVGARTPSVAALARELVEAIDAGPEARAAADRIAKVLASPAKDTLVRAPRSAGRQEPRTRVFVLLGLGVVALVAGVLLVAIAPRRAAPRGVASVVAAEQAEPPAAASATTAPAVPPAVVGTSSTVPPASSTPRSPPAPLPLPLPRSTHAEPPATAPPAVSTSPPRPSPLEDRH